MALGRAPGRVPYAYSVYSPASERLSARRPTAEKSQPMALPGRRATMRAPTTMNAVKSNRYSTPAGSRATLPLGMARAAVKARPAA
jgi:hypothetical protein